MLETDAIALYREQLFPLATVITPNLDEAAFLLDKPLAAAADLPAAARELAAAIGAPVLLKGGHLAGDECTDVLAGRDGTTRSFTAPRIDTRASHGTGCTLSAAITARLALGDTLPNAVAAAKDYLNRCLAASFVSPARCTRSTKARCPPTLDRRPRGRSAGHLHLDFERRKIRQAVEYAVSTQGGIPRPRDPCTPCCFHDQQMNERASCPFPLSNADAVPEQHSMLSLAPRTCNRSPSLRWTSACLRCCRCAVMLAACGPFAGAPHTPSTARVPAAWGDFRISDSIIPQGRYGRSHARRLHPAYITIHSTQNFASSANAAAHAAMLRTGALTASHNSLGYLTWHFTVDQSSIRQSLPVQRTRAARRLRRPGQPPVDRHRNV